MIASKFEIRTQKNVKSGIQHLILKGEIGINSIVLVKARIDAINFECDEIFIELKEVDSFDLSSVQLLYALRKSLVEKGKIVTIVSDLPEILSITLKNAGFDEFNN